MLAVTQLIGFAAGGGDGWDIVSVTPSQETVNTTTHNIAMPPTVSPGDLLVIVWANNGNPDSAIYPSFTSNFGFGTGALVVRSAYKVATGGEGGTTEDVTTTPSIQSSSLVYQLRGAEDPGIQAPEVSTTSSTLDPNSLTPTGGPKEFLWLPVAAILGQNITGFPTDYDGTANNQTNVSVAAASRILDATTEDPGTFTAGGAGTDISVTVAIHPE
jgi:hypothetical protein